MKPVPCQHIADYYAFMWGRKPCIGYNFLRWGYFQWAAGQVRDPKVNNLYEGVAT